jgi:hypothetical protein
MAGGNMTETIGYGFAFARWKIASFGPIKRDFHARYCSTCWRVFRRMQERR